MCILKSLAIFLFINLLTITSAIATPVHSFGCKGCHLQGYTINQIGGANVCLQCHSGTGTPANKFSIGDASNLYGNNQMANHETSHNWSSPSTNLAAGADEPLRIDGQMGFFSRYGTTMGLIACSRCHNPHGQIENNPKLLIGKTYGFTSDPMQPNDMCLACHATWNQTDNNGWLTHPIVADYNASVLAEPDKYKATLENTYNAAIQLVTGGVSCTSCHGAHYVDSDATTVDGSSELLNKSDGKLLCGDGPAKADKSSLCQTCHTYTEHGDDSGEKVGCLVCHSGHSYDPSAPNYFVLRKSAATSTYNSVVDLKYSSPSVLNPSLKYTFWNDLTDGTNNGFCEKCHGDAKDIGAGAGNYHITAAVCTDCHSHEGSTFVSHGGGGGSNCETCHGHDAGYEYSPGEYSEGRGTSHSHSTHTEADADDLRGPNISCDECHDTNNFPNFKSGTDVNGDGKFNLVETDVCDTCHSQGGTYDGVDDAQLGAKDNWDAGIYNGAMLQAGKEKWCATCHDEAPSVINGVPAPNVIGDEDGSYTYGSGWGFYKTGHGLDSASVSPASGGVYMGGGKECSDCHDYTHVHVDGKARSFDCTNSEGAEGISCDADEYRQDYRLKTVNGRNPMEIPLASGIAPNPNNYMLCFSNTGCHLPDKYLSKSTAMGTAFRDDQGDSPTANSPYVTPVNAHDYHLNFKVGMGGRMVPDWRSTVSGTFSCTVCHNVHGSTQLAMVRDGKLVGREPGMVMRYTTINAGGTDSMPTPANLTLDASVGTFWDADTSDNLCSDCHGNLGYAAGLIYRRTPPAAQQAPTLDWTGEAGYATDGATPDSAESETVFHFRVEYTDVNHDLPTVIQIWLDLDNNGYEDDEKHDLIEADFDDQDTADGKVYRKTLAVNAVPGTYSYLFHATDRNGIATGDPVTGGTITVTAVANQPPVLSWTGEAEYVTDGVDPQIAEGGSSFTFRVTYTDTVNQAPSTNEVWIDLNDDGDFDDTDEKQTMAIDGGDGDYTNGEIFAYSRAIPYPAGSLGGTLAYRFNFTDQPGDEAKGDPTEPLTFKVREPASACDLTVCTSGCDETTIQTAVAASADGQDVCVYPGTWAPFAFNGRDITVRSLNGPEVTIIDGGGSGNVVNFNNFSGTGSDATLKGFTVRNGARGININNSRAVIVDSSIEGNGTGGIFADNSSTYPVMIEDTEISGNAGPGIQNSNISFTATVTDTAITNNTASSGAAIYAPNGAGTYTFDGCDISGNEATAGSGGAFSIGGRIDLNLSDSKVNSNTASGDGGGIYIYGTPGVTFADVDRTVFAGNQAVNGGGFAVGPGGGTFNFTNTIFSGNYTSGNGGGMITSDSNSTVNTFKNCTLAGNSAEEGGGIYSKVWNVAGLKVHNSILWGNESRSSYNDQIEGPIILDPGSTFYAEVQYSDLGLDQKYSVFTNQAGNMHVDPMFHYPLPASNAPTAQGDYHLTPASPVIDQALAASPPADDFDGQVRPNPDSADMDMGADEYYVYSVNYDATEAGATAAAAADVASINITMPYGNDYNGDSTYSVEYKLSSSGTWLDWGTNPKAHAMSPFTDIITGLTQGESYDVRLTYIDTDGVSGTNPQLSTIVMPDNRTTTGTGTAAMADLTSIDISMPYSDDNNGDNSYTVEYSDDGGGSWTSWVTGAAHTTSPYTNTITGLTAGNTYNIRMTYIDADGVTGSNPQTVSGIELAYNETTVGTATATKASETSINISMPYTNDDNGDNTYTVEYSDDGGGTWTPWITGAAHTASPYTNTITGLASGTYDVRMTYIDADGINGSNPQTVAGIVLASVSCTTTVSGSGNLQPAITSAADGDTICVDEGTYSENITFSAAKNITVVATGAAANTIIQGTSSSNSAVATFSNGAIDNTTVLKGLTINNQRTGSNTDTRGAYITNGASPTIEACIIDDNIINYRNGAGVYITGVNSGATIIDTVISNNTTGTSGEMGGGIRHSGTGTLTITGGSIESNFAYKGGGGLYASGGSVSISGTTIQSNSSTTGGSGGAGGIHYAGTGIMTITDSSIESNTTTKYGGGGIYMGAGTSGIITSSAIRSNVSNAIYGGGGILMEGASLDIEKSFIQGNRVTGTNNDSDGGGINVFSGTVNIDNTIITGNITNSGTYWAEGGGINVWGSSTVVNINHSTVAGNWTNRRGGGVFVASGTANIDGSLFWDNFANDANTRDIYATGTANVSYTAINNGSWYNDNGGNITSITGQVFVTPDYATSTTPKPDGDYHLRSDAVEAIDSADPASTVIEDIDSDSRPVDGPGSGGTVNDMGADEYTP